MFPFKFFTLRIYLDLEMNAAIIYALCCVPIPFNPISPWCYRPLCR